MNPLRAAQQVLFKEPQSFKSFKRKLLDLKINSFQPKLSFSFDVRNYTVKTVDSSQELWSLLRLRHRLFTKAYGQKMQFDDIDFDRYDLLGDHIIVIDNANKGKIIGTYRLICSQFSSEFYSQNEFSLDKFLHSPGVKLELGRACIHEDYRTGMTINLVWKGLSRYAVETKANFLFGCTSVKTTSPAIAMRILKYCQKEMQFNRYDVFPTKKYQYVWAPRPHLLPDIENFEELIPSLMKSYLAAGARVYGLPALDRKFACTDFLTILDLENLTESYFRRYFKAWRNKSCSDQS